MNNIIYLYLCRRHDVTVSLDLYVYINTYVMYYILTHIFYPYQYFTFCHKRISRLGSQNHDDLFNVREFHFVIEKFSLLHIT